MQIGKFGFHCVALFRITKASSCDLECKMDSKALFNAGFFQVIIALISISFVYNLLQYVMETILGKPPQHTTTKRPLGKLEMILDLVSQERQGTGNISLILTLRSAKKLTKAYIHDALVLLAKRQPMLRAIITNSSSQSNNSTSKVEDKHLEIVDGEKISELIDFTNCEVKASEWQDVWNDIACKQRGNGLLWKARVLQEEFCPNEQCYTNTLVFTFCHCCIDGVSSIKFCEQFLYYLNEVGEGSLGSDEGISSLGLSSSVDDLVARKGWSTWEFLGRSLGIFRIFKFMLKMFVRYSLNAKQRNPFFVQFPPNLEPPDSPRTNLICKVFSEIETSNIVKACKLNKCTVTGALMAATHVSFCRLIEGKNDGGKSCKLEHDFAISGRRYCHPKPHDEYLGDFALISPLILNYMAENKVDFWKLAQECTKRIQCLVKDERRVTGIIMLFDLFSIEKLANEFFCPVNRQDVIRLSNCNMVSSAGSFDFRARAKNHTYKLHECLFNNTVHGMVGIFSHYNVTVNGKMSWSITYDPSKVVNSEQAEKFANLCFNFFIELTQRAAETLV